MEPKKVKLTDIGPLPKVSYTTIEVGPNDTEVQVAFIIPYEEAVAAVQWAINTILDDRQFVDEATKIIIKHLTYIKHFTNIDTSRLDSAANIYEWYDILDANDVIERVIDYICVSQLSFIEDCIDKTIDSIMQYRNSAVGIVDRLSEQNRADALTMQTVLEQLSGPELEQVNKLLAAMGNDGMPLESTSPVQTHNEPLLL